MPAPMTAPSFGALLEPGLRTVFFKNYGDIIGTSKVPYLYSVVGSQKAIEHDYGLGSFGNVPVYNGAIEYDSFEAGYQTNFTHVEYALGMQVERKLFEDDLYNVMNQRAALLGLSFSRSREVSGASQFNNAFSGSFLGADGVALCSASHPLGPNNSSVLQSNTGVLPLTYDNVIATRTLMRKYVDDRGNLIPIMADTLLVPVELEPTAWNIVNSMNKPGTTDNDGNFVRGLGLNVVAWDYLTDNNNWFLIDSKFGRLHNWWFNRVNTEFASDPNSDYSMIARYRGYMRYSFGWDTWEWIFGHNAP